MHRPIALAILCATSPAGAAAPYRFGSPLALQVVSFEAQTCSRPPAPADRRQPEAAPSGRCLRVDLTIAYRDRQGRVRQQGSSYLLEEGFAERVALDFGPYAAVVLRLLASDLEAAGLGQAPTVQALVPQVLARIRRHLHHRVLPHVELPLELEEAVARVARRFFKLARQPLVITSGPRTPEGQALAMYHKLVQGASLRRLYRKTEAAEEIRAAYLEGRRARKQHDAIIADMAQVIRQQMERGLYVSPHLKAGAVDIRSRNLRQAAKAALRRAVSSFRGMRLIREEKIPPHFHLEVNPVD